MRERISKLLVLLTSLLIFWLSAFFALAQNQYLVQDKMSKPALGKEQKHKQLLFDELEALKLKILDDYFLKDKKK